MNEQKDKLLINLVEPGRIGRTPFNSFFSLSSLFRMGELVKKKRIDGGCGGSGNEAWLGWIVFWWVIGGGSRRQPAKREDEQAKRNVFLLFHLHQLWMKRIIDWEMEWRDEIEERTAQPQSNNPIKWIFSLLIHLMELLGGLEWNGMKVKFGFAVFGWVMGCGSSQWLRPMKTSQNKQTSLKWNEMEAALVCEWVDEMKKASWGMEFDEIKWNESNAAWMESISRRPKRSAVREQTAQLFFSWLCVGSQRKERVGLLGLPLVCFLFLSLSWLLFSSILCGKVRPAKNRREKISWEWEWVG